MVTLRFLFLLLLVTSTAVGQTIEWDPRGGRLAVGQTVQFRLVCRDCQPASTPSPPKVDGLILRYQGTSSNYDFTAGGAATAQVSFVYLAHWSKNENLVIPAFSVVTNRGSVTVPEAVFEPASAMVGESGKPLSSAAGARLEVQPAEVWAGEVFSVAYRIEADGAYQPDFAHTAPEWTAPGLTAEDWAAPEPYEAQGANGPRVGLTYRTHAIASQPGKFTIQPTRQLVNLNVGMNLFGFAPTPRYEQFSVPSQPVTIVARPLPPAPDGFSGAVGHFTIQSKVVPTQAALHEPVTWTVEVKGQGNWPQLKALPARRLTDDFKVVHPQVQRTPAPGRLFEGGMSEDLVLVPSKPGHYTLPAVSWIYFDPESAAYRTATTAPTSIDVAAPPPGSGGTDAGATGAGIHDLPPVPEDPHGLPADPLPLGTLSTAPLAPGALTLVCLSPFGAVLVLWLGLALRCARERDPGRARRVAWQRQAEAVAAAASAAAAGDLPTLRAHLRSWQRAAAVAWGLGQTGYPDQFNGPEQTRLWNEADHAIYGPAAALPPDWPARAFGALRAAPPPKFRWRRALLLRHLLPGAAVVCAAALALAAPPVSAAPSSAGRSEYVAGHYAAAEAAWRVASPLDAGARHNLSLSLAQQGKWNDAAAEAAAAFVQRPRDPEIYRQFSAACERAGLAPGPLTTFFTPTPATRIARTLSAAQWQRCAPLATTLLALGAALLLLRAYQRAWRGPALMAAALTLFAVGAFVGTGAWFAHYAYGLAADPEACFVIRNGSLRSIPTEAVPNQASVPVSAGSIAVPDRKFLGWVRLRFNDSTAGWLRRTDVLPLWR